jgi:hypothetical protein
MIHEFQPNERELYIRLIRSIFDAILKDRTFGVAPLYITGGSARRLYMLENKIPMHVEDVKNIFRSDIDIHSSKFTKSDCGSSFLFNIFDEPHGSCYDMFGLFDTKLGLNYVDNTIKNIFKKKDHIINRMESTIEELSHYRAKLFKEENYTLLDELKSLKLQYIRINVEFGDFAKLSEDIITNFDLKFDLNSCYFVYWRNKCYDKRPMKSDDFFEDHFICNNKSKIANLKSIDRAIKYEKYGFKCDIESAKKMISCEEDKTENFTVFSTSSDYGDTNIDLFAPITNRGTTNEQL